MRLNQICILAQDLHELVEQNPNAIVLIAEKFNITPEQLSTLAARARGRLITSDQELIKKIKEIRQ